MSDALFRPLRIGAIELTGRLVKTATSGTRADADGTCTDLVREFYEPIATGGVPLITTGNIYLCRDGQSGTPPARWHRGPGCVFCNACVGQIGTRALDCFHPEVRRRKDAMMAERMHGIVRPAA